MRQIPLARDTLQMGHSPLLVQTELITLLPVVSVQTAKHIIQAPALLATMEAVRALVAVFRIPMVRWCVTTAHYFHHSVLTRV